MGAERTHIRVPGGEGGKGGRAVAVAAKSRAHAVPVFERKKRKEKV